MNKNIHNNQAPQEVGNYYALREKEFEVPSYQLSEFAEYPTNALVEITNACNHSCVFCKNSHQKRVNGNLDIELYTKFVKEAVSLGLKEIGLYATGEPFMAKNVNAYIKIARDENIQRIYITTNGALASLDKVVACVDAGLNSIKFSINAANRADYELIHGSDDFDKVLENVRNIDNWRKLNKIDLQLIASCVVVPAIKNLREDHYNLFSTIFDDIGYFDSTSQGGQAFELIEINGSMPQGVFASAETMIDQNEISPCQMIWNRYHLTNEGYLTSCCVDYELDLVFGDLNESEISKEWNNDYARKIRKAHLDKNLNGLLCDQCLHNRPAPYTNLRHVDKRTKADAIINRMEAELKNRFGKLIDI